MALFPAFYCARARIKTACFLIVQIRAEIGNSENPPDKGICGIFRRLSTIEHKDSHDRLNWHMIYKVVGYAVLYSIFIKRIPTLSTIDFTSARN